MSRTVSDALTELQSLQAQAEQQAIPVNIPHAIKLLSEAAQLLAEAPAAPADLGDRIARLELALTEAGLLPAAPAPAPAPEAPAAGA